MSPYRDPVLDAAFTDGFLSKTREIAERAAVVRRDPAMRANNFRFAAALSLVVSLDLPPAEISAFVFKFVDPPRSQHSGVIVR